MNPPFIIRAAICGGVATLLQVAIASAAAPTGNRAEDIKPEKELLITNPAVVDSERAHYPGPWSFGALVEEQVGKDRASDAIRAWLETWTHPVKLNGQTVPPRPLFEQNVIAVWKKRDGFDAKSGEKWKPKLENAPFRLLAIVNRVDLSAPSLAKSQASVEDQWKATGRGELFTKLLDRTTTSVPLKKIETSPDAVETATTPQYYNNSPLIAGEGRLVFGATDADGKPLAGDWTLIFEYALPAQTANEEPWAKRWHALGELEFTDQRFGTALESLVTGFTARRNSAATLSQIRTSEAAFGPGREFRQYVLDTTGGLALSPLPQTPAPEFMVKNSREQRALAAFLDIQSPLIRSGIGGLPQTIEVGAKTTPLLAARALIPANDPMFCWDFGRAVQPDPRRLFSLNTCNGCHAGETGCRDGLHVRPRAAGQEALVSEFLRAGDKGLRLDDPAARGTKIEYHEMEDRIAIFTALLEPKERARLDALRDVLRTRLRRTH